MGEKLVGLIGGTGLGEALTQEAGGETIEVETPFCAVSVASMDGKPIAESDKLLIVASDRISAFDSVLASGIPGKGKVLTALSLFWFDLLRDVTANHLVTADVCEMGSVIADPKLSGDDLIPAWDSPAAHLAMYGRPPFWSSAKRLV